MWDVRIKRRVREKIGGRRTNQILMAVRNQFSQSQRQVAPGVITLLLEG